MENAMKSMYSVARSTAPVIKRTVRLIGPEANGTLMTPREFDRASFVREYRFELVQGVVVVAPPPLENESDPNDELGYLLRTYKDNHPQGGSLDLTLPQYPIPTRENRRVADRVLWCGLGRLPRRSDMPTIVVEFVSKERQNLVRDCITKRDEYLGCGVKEYWIFDRFEHTLTVYGGRRTSRPRVFRRKQTYTTPLLPASS
jgi:Uma2 family endonuclease